METEPARCWTLDGARAVLDEVRTRTERAVLETEGLVAERERAGRDAKAIADVERRIQATVGRWAREMEALGAEVKGLWLIDFDNGSGYYCWKWPEPELAWFHSYEDGFAGRIRIQ